LSFFGLLLDVKASLVMVLIFVNPNNKRSHKKRKIEKHAVEHTFLRIAFVCIPWLHFIQR
jgi:hypothetical protein